MAGKKRKYNIGDKVGDAFTITAFIDDMYEITCKNSHALKRYPIKFNNHCKQCGIYEREYKIGQTTKFYKILDYLKTGIYITQCIKSNHITQRNKFSLNYDCGTCYISRTSKYKQGQIIGSFVMIERQQNYYIMECLKRKHRVKRTNNLNAICRACKKQDSIILNNESTFNSWCSMRQRTTNKNNKNYKQYGAAGILCCSSWAKFENFLNDMGPRPKGTTLDRWPDKGGNYEPGNCRWATPEEQLSNRRSVDKTNYVLCAFKDLCVKCVKKVKKITNTNDDIPQGQLSII